MTHQITFVWEMERNKIHYTVTADGRNIGGGIVRTMSDLEWQMQKYAKKGLEVKKNKKRRKREMKKTYFWLTMKLKDVNKGNWVSGIYAKTPRKIIAITRSIEANTITLHEKLYDGSTYEYITNNPDHKIDVLFYEDENGDGFRETAETLD